MSQRVYYIEMSFNLNQKNETMSEHDSNQKRIHNRVLFWTLLYRVMKTISRETVLFVLVFSMILLYFWNKVNYCEDQVKQLCSDGITVLSCILGLTITGYSVILTINQDVVEKLSKPFKKHQEGSLKLWNSFINWLHPEGSNPYEILCSSFVLCCTLLLITIITLVLYKNQPIFVLDNYILFIKWLCIVCALLVLDIIFHLFAVSTYIKK